MKFLRSNIQHRAGIKIKIIGYKILILYHLYDVDFNKLKRKGMQSEKLEIADFSVKCMEDNFVSETIQKLLAGVAYSYGMDVEGDIAEFGTMIEELLSG